MLSLTEHGVFVYPIGNGNQNKDIHMSDTKDLPEWLTTAEASEVMGVEKESVQRLCRRGRINCQKFGRDWMVHRDSALDYEVTVGGRGKTAGDMNL